MNVETCPQCGREFRAPDGRDPIRKHLDYCEGPPTVEDVAVGLLRDLIFVDRPVRYTGVLRLDVLARVYRLGCRRLVLCPPCAGPYDIDHRECMVMMCECPVCWWGQAVGGR